MASLRHPRTWALAGLILAAAWCLGGPATATVLAHGGEPQITLSKEQADPGDSVIVVGTDLGALSGIPVSLLGPDEPVVLALAEGNDHGDFTVTITIPPDTPTGDYSIGVTAADETLITAALRIGPPDAPIDSAGTSEELVAPTDETGATPAEAPEPSDPTSAAAPLGEGIRDLAFVVLVAGSFAVAAWGFGGRWRA